MPDKAVTALDYAKREKAASVKQRIERLALKYGLKFTDDHPAGIPVKARLDFGRWIADCECGGAEAVDPKEPIFFCVSCGNLKVSGRLRRVVFPDDWQEIEAQVMSIPIKRKGSGDKINQQLRAIPAEAPRNWKPED